MNRLCIVLPTDNHILFLFPSDNRCFLWIWRPPYQDIFSLPKENFIVPSMWYSCSHMLWCQEFLGQSQHRIKGDPFKVIKYLSLEFYSWALQGGKIILPIAPKSMWSLTHVYTYISHTSNEQRIENFLHIWKTSNIYSFIHLFAGLIKRI